MSSLDFVKLALQMATMLGFAVLCGEIMRRLRQPAVVGEMLGGILLGPTVFGWLAPSLHEWLFLSSAHVTVARDTSTKLGMLFFLFYAGLEVNLSDLRALGKRAVLIGLIGTLLPIAAGVALVYSLPAALWGAVAQEHFLSFALFVGMNLANSANPVIARILMDLGLLNRPIGALVMTATIVDDLVNWTLFAIILRDIAPSGPAASGSLVTGLALVGLLFVVILVAGRGLGSSMLGRIQTRVAWPSGFIALVAILVLLASSASEALGVHAFLGAFLMGVALGDSRERHKEAHDVIGYFVMSFAPIYFVSMGMSTNFITSFDPLLVMVILAAACISKVGSVLAGAKAAGMPWDRETWAVAFGLNARGATGDHPGGSRAGQRRHRCAHLRGHGGDGAGHVADGRTDHEPSAGGSGQGAVLASSTIHADSSRPVGQVRAGMGSVGRQLASPAQGCYRGAMMILATAAARPGLQLGLAAIAGAACLMTVAAGAGERPATPQRPCTMIGCDDGLKVELRSAGPWPAGEYRFAIRLDGVPIECSGTLPLKECAARSVTCDREGMVQVVESGCALPAVAQSFPELRLEPRLRPRKVEISVTRDGERVGGADIAADFRKVHPNGQECPPACEAARAALDLDFRQR